ncbi:methyltransferase domain-containing protein [Corynebacterium sp. 320]|nr:methyltransferase domain-containing protein [Corynebacterium sp. 320]KAB1551494.1 methyltransferase domain-containing protein [Corynebacterium sp. 321]KAB1551678.1 methyltransferase domain-containing protein [Corynebacterium sp. 319]KAB3525690.1 methyltransferase domain-containing protein [Corynebacterium sp. 250]KAB3538668.1 methyltransferase domain-containing protein [Corynebacterium sp. 366]
MSRRCRSIETMSQHLPHAHATAFLLPHLTATTRLLDLGCGHGSLTLDLAAHVESLSGAASQVTGVDINPDAIATATTAAAERESAVSFTQGNADALPFEDNSFDVVFASQVLHHVPDPVAALRECARVLAPGGLIAAREVDYGAMTWYPPHPGLSRWRAVFSVVADLADAQPNAGRHLPTWFVQAGLDDLQVSSSNGTYASSEQRKHLASTWVARTQDEDYQQRVAVALGDIQNTSRKLEPSSAQTSGQRTTTQEAIAQIVEGWNTWKDTPGALFIMPHVEVVATVTAL